MRSRSSRACRSWSGRSPGSASTAAPSAIKLRPNAARSRKSESDLPGHCSGSELNAGFRGACQDPRSPDGGASPSGDGGQLSVLRADVADRQRGARTLEVSERAIPAVWIVVIAVIRFRRRVAVFVAACGDDVDRCCRPGASDASPAVRIGCDQFSVGVSQVLAPGIEVDWAEHCAGRGWTRRRSRWLDWLGARGSSWLGARGLRWRSTRRLGWLRTRRLRSSGRRGA